MLHLNVILVLILEIELKKGVLTLCGPVAQLDKHLTGMQGRIHTHTHTHTVQTYAQKSAPLMKHYNRCQVMQCLANSGVLKVV